LDRILGSQPSGRLHKQLVESGLATSVWAWSNRQLEPGLFLANATAGLATDLQATKDALLQTTENVARVPITREELDRARRQELNEFDRALSETDRLGVEMSNWIAAGDWRLFFLHRDRFE